MQAQPIGVVADEPVKELDVTDRTLMEKERRGSVLTELEVDLGAVVDEKNEEFPIESDHSPYAEGKSHTI